MFLILNCCKEINLNDLKKVSAKESKNPIHYCIFDVVYTQAAGDTRKLPLLERKNILKKLLTYNKTLVYSEHKTGDGIPYFKYACKHGWEGLIAKKANSVYVGKRSRDWLKFKCVMEQELIICGYTKPQGSRTDFGALLVGYYAGSQLVYAGKVGTGFSQTTLALLGKKMRALEIKNTPFDAYDGSEKNVHWVKPVLVAEFGFAQWTRGGKLRVGRYRGLRDDKKARDVVQEKP